MIPDASRTSRRLRGIDDVIGGQPVMQPAGGFGMAGRRHAFGDSGGEGDHVVLHLALDLLDAADVEAGVLAQEARGVLGNLADIG